MHISTNKYLFLLLLFLPTLCLCQQDPSSQKKDSLQKKDSSSPKKDVFNAGVNYQSRLHYFGRTDSLQSSGLLPTIGYQFKFGLYAQGNFIFTQNPVQPLTYVGTTIEAGYKFEYKKHFNGNVFYTGILYNDKSDLPQSVLKAQTGVNVTYTNKIVNVNAGGDLKFSDKTDVGATVGLDHIFIIHKRKSKIAFALDPLVYMYMGTQNFTNTYLQQKNILGVPITQQVTESETQFNILSYEVSMPLVLVVGKFNASITPSYVMPQNLIVGEIGQNMFYIVAGIGVRL